MVTRNPIVAEAPKPDGGEDAGYVTSTLYERLLSEAAAMRARTDPADRRRHRAGRCRSLSRGAASRRPALSRLARAPERRLHLLARLRSREARPSAPKRGQFRRPAPAHRPRRRRSKPASFAPRIRPRGRSAASPMSRPGPARAAPSTRGPISSSGSIAAAAPSAMSDGRTTSLSAAWAAGACARR